MPDINTIISSPHDWLRTNMGWVALTHIVTLAVGGEGDDEHFIYGETSTGQQFTLAEKGSPSEMAAQLDWIVGVPVRGSAEDETTSSDQ